MKGLAWGLMLFYLLVIAFWVANSPYLFSLWGIVIWLISIVLGFVVYEQIKEPKIIRKLILYSSSFMVFLVIVTGLIHFAVTSMP
ncbi:hypothetical protein CWR48_16285 [Oceanobacillus arenosus]|uniref:Uncharacterized protein n=1 Tax=Oceanobacillus arenosus TaxID=1229153 RepID=A0A3D8PKI1_9BACI|nr:hypothetical protein [Oceanobacillus arenosus]RDW16596.1 hypothetical protein CWR48_16285 [Oceanobacillus arenosus]